MSNKKDNVLVVEYDYDGETTGAYSCDSAETAKKLERFLIDSQRVPTITPITAKDLETVKVKMAYYCLERYEFIHDALWISELLDYSNIGIVKNNEITIPKFDFDNFIKKNDITLDLVEDDGEGLYVFTLGNLADAKKKILAASKELREEVARLDKEEQAKEKQAKEKQERAEYERLHKMYGQVGM